MFERNCTSGLTRIESTVLALWDRDVPISAIACRTGLKKDRVRRIVTQLSGGNQEHRAHRAAMQRGSNALLAAMRGAGRAGVVSHVR